MILYSTVCQAENFGAYDKFFDKVCDVNKFEALEMDTHSLYLASVEQD